MYSQVCIRDTVLRILGDTTFCRLEAGYTLLLMVVVVTGEMGGNPDPISNKRMFFKTLNTNYEQFKIVKSEIALGGTFQA